MNATTPTALKHQVQIDNLNHAHRILSEVACYKLDLDRWVRAHPPGQPMCGTIFCAAGWLAHSEEFARMLTIVTIKDEIGDSVPMLTACDSKPELKEGGNGYSFKFLDPIFGPNAFNMLFDSRGAGWNDKMLMLQHKARRDDQDIEIEWQDDDDVTDKVVALERIKLRIEQLVAQG
jgi:hypothetical protein